jgi:hypothetical protein
MNFEIFLIEDLEHLFASTQPDKETGSWGNPNNIPNLANRFLPSVLSRDNNNREFQTKHALTTLADVFQRFT